MTRTRALRSTPRGRAPSRHLWEVPELAHYSDLLRPEKPLPDARSAGPFGMGIPRIIRRLKQICSIISKFFPTFIIMVMMSVRAPNPT